MKAHASIVLVFALSACASATELSTRDPSATFHSAKARDVIAECLMNRLGSEAIVPEKTVAEGVTTVGFTGHDGLTRPGIYLFTIRDEGNGSAVEMRTMKGLWKIKSPIAETCF